MKLEEVIAQEVNKQLSNFFSELKELVKRTSK